MDDETLGKEIMSRFPESTLLEVQFLRHDGLPVVGPGELLPVLVPRGPEEHNADWRIAPEDVRNQVVHTFHETYKETLDQLGEDLPELASDYVRGVLIHYGAPGVTMGITYRGPRE
ncbi:MAG: hypothetical protein CL878_15390 [Dehalococcoidia bacterium]|nr:hypothetical protein [Dehalococcoidia bacterium]